MLTRFDPFLTHTRPTRGQLSAGSSRQVNGMPFDAYRQGDTFFAHFDVAGVDPTSITLTVENNVLTVSATRTNQWGDGVEPIVNERPSGSFTRQLFLDESLGADLMVATCDNGVLTIAIPVAEKAKPRKVEINHGATHGNSNGNGGSASIPAEATA